MSAPLVVNTRDGAVWTRRAVTRGGLPLYALAGSPRECPENVMATLAELAEYGITGSADALPVPVGPEPQTLSVERLAEIEERGAHLYEFGGDVSVDEWNRLAGDDVPALVAEVRRLLAERQSTNESLDDAVQELRTPYAERARRETHPGRRQAWRMLAQAEESERVANALLAPEVARSADRLTRLLGGGA